MRCAVPLLLLGLAAGPVLAQGSTARATTPDAAVLDRLGLKADWSAFVPVMNRQDGLSRVQVVDANQVFVQTKGGVLLALDAGTGREQWKFRFPVGFTDGYSVAVNEQFVYSVNVARLYCHNRYTGVLEFEFALPEAPAVGPVSDGDQLYVTFTSAKVACYDLPPSFHTSPAAKKKREEDRKRRAADAALGGKTDGGVSDRVADRSPGRLFPALPAEPESERFSVPSNYFESGFGSGANQPTFSVAALQQVTPPYFTGGLNKVVSVAMLPSVKQPYNARPEYLTYNQLTPSVAVIPPSIARVFELSNLRPPPFQPSLRWITETRGKVYAEPIFVPESRLSAPRVWIAEDGRYLQAVIRDRDEYEKGQQVWKLTAATAAGLAGPYSFAKNQALAFLPVSDGQVLAIDLFGGTQESPRYEFRTNVGGPLNRKPIGAADGVYVGGDRSGTARINVKTGDVDWRTDGEVDRIVAVTDSYAFARDRRGNLLVYAKGKADPNTLKARPLGTLAAGEFGVTVANDQTDRVILAADNGLVVSLREAGAKANKPKSIVPALPLELTTTEAVPADPNAPKPDDKKPEEKK
jgi:outer membrane protein assembly factor BamB